MSPILLIRDTAELSGTCYFEFLPGPYRDQHWNSDSVFLAEDVFELIQPIIVKYVPQFNYFSFTPIRWPEWKLIISDLGKLASTSGNRELGIVASELSGWLKKQLTEHDCVTILGI